MVPTRNFGLFGITFDQNCTLSPLWYLVLHPVWLSRLCGGVLWCCRRSIWHVLVQEAFQWTLASPRVDGQMGWAGDELVFLQLSEWSCKLAFHEVSPENSVLCCINSPHCLWHITWWPRYFGTHVISSGQVWLSIIQSLIFWMLLPNIWRHSLLPHLLRCVASLFGHPQFEQVDLAVLFHRLTQFSVTQYSKPKSDTSLVCDPLKLPQLTVSKFSRSILPFSA